MDERNLRILHVASADLWGGAEAVVFELVTAQAQNPNLRVFAALLNEGELADRLRRNAINVRVFDETQLSPASIVGQLTRWIREIRPHVTHTHRLKENVLGSLASRMAGVPVSIRTQHGAPEHAVPSLRIDKRLARWLDVQSAFRLQQCIVAVSEELADYIRHAYPGALVEIIPNGVNVARLRQLARDSTGFDPRFFHIGFVGRLAPVKRIDVFLDSAHLLMKHWPERYVFHVVGDGPLAEPLKALAAELGLNSERCVFHGFHTDSHRIIAALDCLVLTSDHEGMPMTALESLALGVPVVAHSVGGLRSLLTDVAKCRLVASQDSDAVANAIRDVTTTKHYGQGRSLLPEAYCITDVCDRYVHLYRRLLAQQFGRV